MGSGKTSHRIDQEGFAAASFHLVDLANRSSIRRSRCNNFAQLLDVKFDTSLQELLLLVYQETAV